MLEDQLRATFTAAADRPLPLTDAATQAIRRGQLRRRWRNALAGAAAVVSVFGFAGGLIQIQDWRQVQGGGGGGGIAVTGLAEESESDVDFGPAVTSPPPKPQVQGPPPALDLVAAGQLWTADGKKVKVSAPADQDPVSPAYRLPAGWLVDADGRLALVDAGGKRVPLATAESWAVDAAGTRLAYVNRAHLFIARLDKSGLAPLADTAVPAGTVAVTFVGERIVLGAVTGGAITAYDHWSTTGPYSPTWTDRVRAVYGLSGGSLVGLATGTQPGTICLARLALVSTGFDVTATAGCELDLAATGVRVSMSPDGRWLAVRRSVSVAIYEVAKFFADTQSSALCLLPGGSAEWQSTAQLAADRAGGAKTLAAAEPATGTPIWEGANSLLLADSSGALRCRTDGTVERAALPVDTPASQLFSAGG